MNSDNLSTNTNNISKSDTMITLANYIGEQTPKFNYCAKNCIDIRSSDLTSIENNCFKDCAKTYENAMDRFKNAI